MSLHSCSARLKLTNGSGSVDEMNITFEVVHGDLRMGVDEVVRVEGGVKGLAIEEPLRHWRAIGAYHLE